jgi:hypothetical protein
VVFSEVQALLDLIERASGWLTVALERSKRKRERAAARVLIDAGVLVAAMRTYDNTYRRVLRRMRLLQPGASQEEREQVVEELMSFNERLVIRPQITQAYASLEAEASDPEQPPEIQALLEIARVSRIHRTTGRRCQGRLQPPTPTRRDPLARHVGGGAAKRRRLRRTASHVSSLGPLGRCGSSIRSFTAAARRRIQPSSTELGDSTARLGLPSYHSRRQAATFPRWRITWNSTRRRLQTGPHEPAAPYA